MSYMCVYMNQGVEFVLRNNAHLTHMATLDEMSSAHLTYHGKVRVRQLYGNYT